MKIAFEMKDLRQILKFSWTQLEKNGKNCKW